MKPMLFFLSLITPAMAGALMITFGGTSVVTAIGAVLLTLGILGAIFVMFVGVYQPRSHVKWRDAYRKLTYSEMFKFWLNPKFRKEVKSQV